MICVIIAHLSWSFPTRERGLKLARKLRGFCSVWSFPTRERGLKFRHWTISQQSAPVVPHAGTWIEISTKIRPSISFLVVPHAGTWIEIGVRFGHVLFHTVVPHAGTWIEITSPSLSVVALQCRSPRGNVD